MNEVVAAIGAISTATLHEAGGKIGALPASLRPVRLGMRIIGPALPVSGPTGDNLWLHRAIEAAQPGEVMVAAVGDEPYGYWGEVMAVAAQARGVVGLVITGGVRDGDQMAERGFAVFSGSRSIRGTNKDPQGVGSIGEPVKIGEVTISRGDVVVADNDGVLVLPKERAADIARIGRARDAAEADIIRRLGAGETTMDIYKLARGGA